MTRSASPSAVRRATLTLAVLGLALSSLASGTAFAQAELSEVESGPAVSLRVTPATLQLTDIQTGGVEHLRVENTGTRPVVVDTDLAGFSVTEDGTTRFTGPTEASAVNWVTLGAETFELDGGERYELAVSVDIPDDAEPGERYVSVLLSVPPPAVEDGNIPVTHRVAARLYIDVPGQRVELIELGELTGPRIMDGRGEFAVPVHNRGTVHRQFARAEQLVATTGDHQIPFPAFTVLADSTRVVETVWTDPPVLCLCSVTISVDNGQGAVLTASTRVLVFPWRATLILLALLAGLALFRTGRQRSRQARHHTRPEAAPANPIPQPPQPSPAATPPEDPHQRQPATEDPHPRLFTAHGQNRRRRPR